MGDLGGVDSLSAGASDGSTVEEGGATASDYLKMGVVPGRLIKYRRLQLGARIPLRYFKSEPSAFNRAVQGGLDRGRSWTVDL